MYTGYSPHNGGKMDTRIVYRVGVTDLEAAICEVYWQERPSSNGFVFNREEVGEIFGISGNRVTKIVKESSKLIAYDFKCPKCGRVRECHTRVEVYRLDPRYWQCDKCLHTSIADKGIEQLYLCSDHFQLGFDELHKTIENTEAFINHQLENIVPIDSLNDLDKLLLCILIGSYGEIRICEAFSLTDTLAKPLSPTLKTEEEIIQKLLFSNVLLLVMSDAGEHIFLDEDSELAIDYLQATFKFAYSNEDLIDFHERYNKEAVIEKMEVNGKYKDWYQRLKLINN